MIQKPPLKPCAKMPLDLGALLGAREESADAAEHGEEDEEADRQEGRELDQRLGGDGDDQALLVLGGIDVAGAEQDGERRHRQGDDEGGVGRQIELLQRPRAEQRVDRKGDRLQLQRDVGQRAGNGDDGDDGGDRLALAVAGGEEVGDRGDVLALGQPHDAQQEAPAEGEQQDRAEIDGDEIVAASRRPGRRCRRTSRTCSRRPATGRRSAAGRRRPCVKRPARVGIPRQRKQDADVSQRQRDDTPAFDHVSLAQLSASGARAAVSRRDIAPLRSRSSNLFIIFWLRRSRYTVLGTSK